MPREIRVATHSRPCCRPSIKEPRLARSREPSVSATARTSTPSAWLTVQFPFSQGAHMKAITAKIGLDGHFRGIKFVTRVLRDAGVEVVFLGFHNSAEQVVKAVVDEDAQLLALSFLSPDYLAHVRQIRELFDEQHIDDVRLIIGGLIDPDDHEELRRLGVDRVFGPGTTSEDINSYLAATFGGAELPGLRPPPPAGSRVASLQVGEE